MSLPAEVLRHRRRLLFGSLLGIGSADLARTALLDVACVALLLGAGRGLLATSYAPAAAAALGFRRSLYDAMPAPPARGRCGHQRGHHRRVRRIRPPRGAGSDGPPGHQCPFASFSSWPPGWRRSRPPPGWTLAFELDVPPGAAIAVAGRGHLPGRDAGRAAGEGRAGRRGGGVVRRRALLAGTGVLAVVAVTVVVTGASSAPTATGCPWWPPPRSFRTWRATSAGPGCGSPASCVPTSIPRVRAAAVGRGRPRRGEAGGRIRRRAGQVDGQANPRRPGVGPGVRGLERPADPAGRRPGARG